MLAVGINLLGHLSQCLTSDALATLPIRLLLCEIDRAPSQSTLLEDPAALVHESLNDFELEVIDILADGQSMVAKRGRQVPWAFD